MTLRILHHPRHRQRLRLTCELFAAREDTLRHAILLTDGQNEHESAAELDAAIELCAGVFSCDCRGVGTDWHVDELRKISTGLLGSVDIVPALEEQRSEKYRHALIAVVSIGVRAGQLGGTDAWLSSHLVSHA